MSWTQLRGLPRNAGLAEGLEARIADPLWMLARQRQFGALRGEDAGSPVQVEISHTATQVDEIRADKETWSALDKAALPVEPFVEADPVQNGPAGLRCKVEAAMDFLARCPASARAVLRRLLQDAFPLEASELVRDRMLSLVAARAFDPEDFIEAGLRKLSGELERLEVSEKDIEAIGGAFDIWSKAQGARFVSPKMPGGFWSAQRMAYGFDLRASNNDARLSFTSYDGTRFDWYQATISSPDDKAFGPSEKPETEKPLVSRVRYPGMPSRRFWDFEDRRVNFGGLEAGIADLPQLLLVEFATVYSDDWYVAPLRVPAGALDRIEKVTAWDVFGGDRGIGPAAALDGEKRTWRFFELTGDGSAAPGREMSPWLYVPRVVSAGHQSAAVEEVELRRDEAANLAWGIERKVESAAARAFDRDMAWAQIRATLAEMEAAPEGEGLEGAWRYVLETETPGHWVPFAPTAAKGWPDGGLERRRVSLWARWPERLKALAGPRGEMLAPTGPLTIDEAALPRGGLVLTRHYQSARGPDGRLLIWAGRRRRPAGPGPASGRETDLLLTPEGRPVDGPRGTEPEGGG